MNEILHDILVLLVVPVIGILGTLFGRLLMHQIDRIKDNNLRAFAYMAVQWASKTFVGGGRGKEKYIAVSNKIKEKYPWAKDVDIAVAIESAVDHLSKELGNADASEPTS